MYILKSILKVNILCNLFNKLLANRENDLLNAFLSVKTSLIMSKLIAEFFENKKLIIIFF